MRRQDWATKRDGKFVSKGKSRVKTIPAPSGSSVQVRRQRADEELKRVAGLVSEYLHESTLSRPFANSNRRPKKVSPPDKPDQKEAARREAQRKKERQQRPVSLRPPLPSGLRIQVLMRDKYQCRYCGSLKGPFHVDHVQPWSKGGTDTDDNLVTACIRCNLRKGSKVWVPKPISV